MVDSASLLKNLRWRKPAEGASAFNQGYLAVKDAGRAGLFISNTLESCSVADMPIVMQQYIATNKQADVIDALRYVNRRGFLHVEASALLSSDVTDWKRPLGEEEKLPNWQTMWNGEVPTGTVHVDVRNVRAEIKGRILGRSMTLAQTRH